MDNFEAATILIKLASVYKDRYITMPDKVAEAVTLAIGALHQISASQNQK